MSENQMPLPVRQTCMLINQYEEGSIEIISDQVFTPGLSKIRFRRYLTIKIHSLIHEFELMSKTDPQYVRELVFSSSGYGKLLKLMTDLRAPEDEDRNRHERNEKRPRKLPGNRGNLKIVE